MDHNFTQKVQDWLNTPANQRNLDQGALYLLQLSGNRILYRNIMANPKRHAEDIEYQLNKYLKYRLQALTHEQVEQMQQQVNAIIKRDHLDAPVRTKKQKEAAAEEFKKGKRADHDTLPEDIQARYSENLSLLQNMRALHAKLVVLSTANVTCPDSERYPFLKELIELDKRYHANWKAYDTYGK